MNAQATIAVGTREELSLDGAWRFRLAGHGDWRTANVPNPWQAEFADLRHSSGRATYARDISIPAAWRGREVAIRFGAVNYFAEVRLNDQVLGTHEGGYLPFEFVLPADAPAENALEVHVTLPSGDAGEYPDYPFGEIPHGKQSWYGPLGGIWQSVKLVARDRRHIAHVAIDADADSGAVTFRARTAAPGLDPPRQRRRCPRREHRRRGHPQSAVAEALVARQPQPLHRDLELVGRRQGGRRDDPQLRLPHDRDRATASSSSTASRSTCAARSTRTTIRRASARRPRSNSSRTRRARPSSSASTCCAATSRCRTRATTRSPTGSACWSGPRSRMSQYFTAKSAQRMRDTMAGILERDGNHPSIIAWTHHQRGLGHAAGRERRPPRSWLKRDL